MITCWHYRRIISNSADGGDRLPPAAQEHIAECPACRAHHESETTIAQRLAAGADAQQSTPSPFLHARIMSGIVNQSQIPERRTATAWRWSLALGTACALFAAFLWPRHQPATIDSPPQAAVLAPVPDVSVETKWPSVNLRAWSGKVEDPLETEMKLVVSDTKSAVNSLANNFLPQQLRTSLFNQAEDPQL